MTEEARHTRNLQRLTQCYPPFAARVQRLIADLEREGFRPRIQDAWRVPAAQAAAQASGNSQVAWSFHQATTPDGRPDALAVDLLDDDYPVLGYDQAQWPDRFRQYLLWLASLAPQFDLETGIAWGLTPQDRRALYFALSTDPLTYRGEIGWDPTHLEPRQLTRAAARRGVRPWT